MKSMHRVCLSGVLLALVLAFGLTGCSELKTDLPAPSTGELKVHPDGWTTPASVNFHGMEIRSQGWDMKRCQTCHGSRYDGGIAQTSCLTCHTKAGGPENCATCHGTVNPAPPRDLSGNTARTARAVGAHQLHLLGGVISRNAACTECHAVPSSVSSPGHIDAAGVATPADILFAGSYLPQPTPAPSYNPQTLKCSNTYCHGNFRNGNNFAPVWNDVSGTQAACGTCHGDVTKPTLAERALPKTTAQGGTHPVYNFATTPCSRCHEEVVDASMKIINTNKHINGKISIGTGEFEF